MNHRLGPCGITLAIMCSLACGTAEAQEPEPTEPAPAGELSVNITTAPKDGKIPLADAITFTVSDPDATVTCELTQGGTVDQPPCANGSASYSVEPGPLDVHVIARTDSGQLAEDRETFIAAEVAATVTPTATPTPDLTPTATTGTDGGEGDPPWLVALLIVAALAALAGCAVAVSRAFRARRRARWQLAARTEPPGDPCKEGSRYCRKLTIAIEPGPRHVAYLELTATDTVQHTLHRQLTGLLVDELNDALHEYRRRRETAEALRHSLVAPADRLVTEAETWLGADRRKHDVTTAAHVVHAKIEYEFTLYRCRRGRDRGEWESEDSWTGSLEGDFDEDVAHLQGSQDHAHEVQSTATQLADFVIRAGGPSSPA